VLANLLGDSSIPPDILDEITQAGGGTLYDLNGYPVYYEVSMNETQYNYIWTKQLYDAAKQQAYAKDNVIILPGGSDDPKNPKQAGVEIKAAWKVMSDTEKRSGRFHMVQALLDGSKTPVTVGLVGFHMFISNAGQGIWATFAQVDNAPTLLQGQSVAAPADGISYNFYNPGCKVPGTDMPCPYNVKDADPGQVVQITPNDKTADELFNKYMAQLFAPYRPWQFYRLVNVQWPLSPQPLSKQTPRRRRRCRTVSPTPRPWSTPCFRRSCRSRTSDVWRAINTPRWRRSAAKSRIMRRATASCSSAHRPPYSRRERGRITRATSKIRLCRWSGGRTVDRPSRPASAASDP
jgi:hypothetical protein